jgi:hypothetical protein
VQNNQEGIVRRGISKGILVGALAVFLSACTWVKLSPEGEDVRVLEASEVANCEHVGKTTVRTKATIGGLERHEEKVQSELNALARNSAPDIGGDTVVPVDKPVEGSQVFEVYRCLR